MRASAPRFTPLTEAQYDGLKAQVDPTYGAGYALYTELSRHRNAIGTDTDLSRTFAGHLTEANNSRLPFDQVLPSYTEYAAVVEEFLDADEPAPAPAPTPTSRRRSAAVPAPAPVVDADDDGDPDDDFDEDDEPAPAPRPRRTRQRYTPAPAGDDDSEAPAWFAGFAGTFQQWTEDVDDTLEDHEDRLSALERGEVRQDDGTYVPIVQRVVNGTGGVAKVGIAFLIGLVLGIIAFFLLMGFVGIVPGIVLGIAVFLLATGIAVAIFNRTHTAPAR